MIVAGVASVLAYTIVQRAYADMELIDLDQFDGEYVEDISSISQESEL